MNEAIKNMSFTELCDRIRHDYNDSLPEDAYTSVESLVKALTDITKQEDKAHTSLCKWIFISWQCFKGTVLRCLFSLSVYAIYIAANMRVCRITIIQDSGHGEQMES